MGAAHFMEVVPQFQDAIRSAGLTPPEMLEADGRLHRFASNGKRGDDSGWYVLHGDGIPAGSFGDWRTGLNQLWRADIGRRLTPGEESEHQARVEAMRQQREAEVQARRHAAAAEAMRIWRESRPAEHHDYLNRKGIAAHGARLYQGCLVLALHDNAGTIHSLQFISPEGDKRFLTGGRVQGCYFSIGKPEGVLCIAEGFATGASIHQATGHAVAVAFNAENLTMVAKALRAQYHDLKLVLCADDDARTEGNPGLTKASGAARTVGGWLAVPEFGERRPEGATDFNDLHLAQGLEAVKAAIENAQAPQENASDGGEVDPDWPSPQTLMAKVQPEPYPLVALPDTIRAAVEEVAGFVKAPLPLVASSALGALSLAAQAHIDVKRAEKLQGPTGLFLLTIADSGERKSTCDGFFTKAIRDFEEAQAEAAKPVLKDHKAAIEAWEAKYTGIKEKIRRLARDNKPTEHLEASLRDLEHNRPEPPPLPRLLYADATPEALAYGLAKNWPSGGVVTAEAGIVFGAHGMGKDSVMRNLALLNVLWDGGTVTIDRRTAESFVIRKARLTVALQVQEATLQSFFDKTGPLARGTGFLARFLTAWPASTQGYRPFTDPPENWPALAAFNRRLSAILENPVPVDGNGTLSPALLSLTPEAKAAWVDYHDTIECELASGGELYDVRDVASKSADNAARLAALFQIFEHGPGGAIGLDCFQSAGRIAAWHLNESRRFFGELVLPMEMADAARLDGWLIEHCRRGQTSFVPTREAQRLGPVRDKDRLATALRELAELERVQVTQEGRRKTIRVNPALLGGTP